MTDTRKDPLSEHCYRKPLRCRLGFHTVERSQGVVGYCLRGCGDLKRHHSNGRMWTRYTEQPAPRVGGHPPPIGRKPPPPPPPPAARTRDQGTIEQLRDELNEVGADCSRLESDLLELHDQLEAAGLPGAINSTSISERIGALIAAKRELRHAAMWVVLTWDTEGTQHNTMPALREALGLPRERPYRDDAEARLRTYLKTPCALGAEDCCS